MKIAPSILDADFEILQEELNSIATADRIHLDIMDGHYVPATTFDPADIAPYQMPVETEAHLMVENPEAQFDAWQSAGVSGIIFHIETTGADRALELLQDLQSRALRAGICVDGYTSPDELTDEILDAADQILIMSVKAGEGGQSFMPEALDKIKSLRDRGFEGEIEVDGGVKLDNVAAVAAAGADIVVVGSGLMKLPPEERAAAIAQFQGV